MQPCPMLCPRQPVPCSLSCAACPGSWPYSPNCLLLAPRLRSTDNYGLVCHPGCLGSGPLSLLLPPCPTRGSGKSCPSNASKSKCYSQCPWPAPLPSASPQAERVCSKAPPAGHYNSAFSRLQGRHRAAENSALTTTPCPCPRLLLSRPNDAACCPSAHTRPEVLLEGNLAPPRFAPSP